MERLDSVSDMEYVFGIILVAANKLDTLLDRTLKEYNITSKQWFLLLVVMNLFDSPPTLKEVAKEMGTSHQNVKQLALKLAAKEMLNLEKDSQDQRVTRITVTEKSFAFWQEIAPEGMRFMDEFYAGINPENMNAARRFFSTIMANIDRMERVSEE